MATCDISGILYKTAGLTAGTAPPLISFSFTVADGELDGSAIGQAGVTITTDSAGEFAFVAQRGSFITVRGNFVLGDYNFKSGVRLFVPDESSIDFKYLKTPDDYCKAVMDRPLYAPADATIIVQTANASLPNAQALGALATGLVKNTTTTGVLSIATAADMPSPTSLTELVSPDGAADLVGVWDADASAWKKVALNNLPGGGGGGAVSSVFGRTGAVVAATNDYTWAQIDKATSSLADITTRSASDLSSGTLPDARFPSTLPALSGANLTALNASNLGSGTVPLARLSGITTSELSATAGITNGQLAGSIALSKLSITGTPDGTKYLRDDGSWRAIPGGGDALTSNPLSQFAATTSAQLAGVLSDETGFSSGALAVFSKSPTIETPTIASFNNANHDHEDSTGGGQLTTAALTGLGTGIATALGVNIGSAGAPVLFNGAGGTPSSLNLSNATALPLGSVTGLGTGVATALAVNVGSAGAFVTFNGALGTPSSVTLTNATGLPVASGISGLGTGVATFLATPSSANLAAAITDETGTGLLVGNDTPTIITPSFTTGFTIGGTAATGTIPRGNGTNFVASAFTLAAPGTSGNVLTSNGTNWVSSAPSGGGITVNTTTITSGAAGAVPYNNAGTYGESNLNFASNVLTFTRTGIGAVFGLASIGLEITNTTPAALNAQQFSPALVLTGQGWKTNATAASQPVQWILQNSPIQGSTVPTGRLSFLFSANGAAASEIFRINSATNVGVDALGHTIGASNGGQLGIGTGGTFNVFLRGPATGTLAFGAADAAAPVAQTQSVQNVVAGTSNTAGAAWTRDASRGTGTGAGGRHVWRTAPAGSTGTSQNALVEACAIESSGTFKLKTLAFSALPTAIADGEMFYCSDGAVTNGSDNTLTSGGSGALAVRINGAWRAFNLQN